MILVYVIKEPPPPPRKTRAELMKDIDADYYGYRDEDDGILVPIEREMEKKVRQLFFDLYFCPMAEYFMLLTRRPRSQSLYSVITTCSGSVIHGQLFYLVADTVYNVTRCRCNRDS